MESGGCAGGGSSTNTCGTGVVRPSRRTNREHREGRVVLLNLPCDRMTLSSNDLTVSDRAEMLARISCMMVGTVTINPSTVAFSELAAGVSMAAFISA